MKTLRPVFIFNLFGASIPESVFGNIPLNAYGSQYASNFSHADSDLVTRAVRAIIYDAAPEQYMDLKILNLGGAPETKPSDEFFYAELPFGRKSIVSNTINAPIVNGSTQTVPVISTDDVNLDLLIKYDDNTQAIVSAIDKNASTVTFKAMNGGTLPLLAAAASGAYTFSNHSPVEGDGKETIQQYFRITPVEHYNYVQMIAKAMRLGKMETYKLLKSGTFDNYLSMQKQRMIMQYRMDISNIYWNGEKGEVTLADGGVAKTAGGIYNLMKEAGSPQVPTTLSNLPAALEEVALDTEFKAYGATRFLYGTPRALYNLSLQYKGELIRYTPDDDTAKLNLKYINIGSSNIVFVPMKRFEEPSCFPSAFRSRLFLLDQNAIKAVQCWGEEMGDTLDRRNNGTLKTYVDAWISGTFSTQFDNPLGSGIVDITNLP